MLHLENARLLAEQIMFEPLNKAQEITKEFNYQYGTKFTTKVYVESFSFSIFDEHGTELIAASY